MANLASSNWQMSNQQSKSFQQEKGGLYPIYGYWQVSTNNQVKIHSNLTMKKEKNQEKERDSGGGEKDRRYLIIGAEGFDVKMMFRNTKSLLITEMDKPSTLC